MNWKFEYPATPPNRKTPRIRGALFEFVKAQLSQKQCATMYDLSPLQPDHAQNVLHAMEQCGWVIRIKPGKLGRIPKNQTAFDCAAIWANKNND